MCFLYCFPLTPRTAMKTLQSRHVRSGWATMVMALVQIQVLGPEYTLALAQVPFRSQVPKNFTFSWLLIAVYPKLFTLLITMFELEPGKPGGIDTYNMPWIKSSLERALRAKSEAWCTFDEFPTTYYKQFKSCFI